MRMIRTAKFSVDNSKTSLCHPSKAPFGGTGACEALAQAFETETKIDKIRADKSLLIVNRRQFLTTLLAALTFPIAQNGQAQSNRSDHFYFARLDSGNIYLPNHEPVDVGQPGSLMKLIAAAALIEQHLPAAYRTIDCKGSVIIDGEKHVCRHVHGRLGLVQALAQSCNVFFSHAAKELSRESFLHYLAKFGLAQSLPESFWQNKGGKLKSIDLILGTAKGFELSATQILQMVALIARRGQLVPFSQFKHPNRKSSVLDPQFSEHTWNLLQQGMQLACLAGTAKNLDPQNKLHVAAKTGTTRHGLTFQSWVAGYFPYQSPRYAFCLRAMVGNSYDQAVPMARKALLDTQWL